MTATHICIPATHFCLPATHRPCTFGTKNIFWQKTVTNSEKVNIHENALNDSHAHLHTGHSLSLTNHTQAMHFWYEKYILAENSY